MFNGLDDDEEIESDDGVHKQAELKKFEAKELPTTTHNIPSNVTDLKTKNGAYDAEFDLDEDWGEDEFQSDDEKEIDKSGKKDQAVEQDSEDMDYFDDDFL